MSPDGIGRRSVDRGGAAPLGGADEVNALDSAAADAPASPDGSGAPRAQRTQRASSRGLSADALEANLRAMLPGSGEATGLFDEIMKQAKAIAAHPTDADVKRAAGEDQAPATPPASDDVLRRTSPRGRALLDKMARGKGALTPAEKNELSALRYFPRDAHAAALLAKSLSSEKRPPLPPAEMSELGASWGRREFPDDAPAAALATKEWASEWGGAFTDADMKDLEQARARAAFPDNPRAAELSAKDAVSGKQLVKWQLARADALAKGAPAPDQAGGTPLTDPERAELDYYRRKFFIDSSVVKDLFIAPTRHEHHDAVYEEGGATDVEIDELHAAERADCMARIEVLEARGRAGGLTESQRAALDRLKASPWVTGREG
jgi:hypothetical protein